MSLVVTDTNWAVHEFADADLGDERRTTRLVELAYVLGQHPTAALPEACGNGGMLKAAYRFFDNDDIAAQDILQSHVEVDLHPLGRCLCGLGRARYDRSQLDAGTRPPKGWGLWAIRPVTGCWSIRR